MKLSEAIMLGSVTCKMEAGNWNSCALGCAANAVGIPRCLRSPLGHGRNGMIYERWPWLAIPCTSTCDAGLVIASRFDLLVCEGKMTLEQLVDYVRSIEPDCGVCNELTCTCAASGATADLTLEVAHA